MTTPAAPVKAKAGRGGLGADLTAGITVALVTIPDAMATAILAGLSPINGLLNQSLRAVGVAGVVCGGAGWAKVAATDRKTSSITTRNISDYPSLLPFLRAYTLLRRPGWP